MSMGSIPFPFWNSTRIAGPQTCKGSGQVRSFVGPAMGHLSSAVMLKELVAGSCSTTRKINVLVEFWFFNTLILNECFSLLANHFVMHGSAWDCTLLRSVAKTLQCLLLIGSSKHSLLAIIQPIKSENFHELRTTQRCNIN